MRNSWIYSPITIQCNGMAIFCLCNVRNMVNSYFSSLVNDRSAFKGKCSIIIRIYCWSLFCRRHTCWGSEHYLIKPESSTWWVCQRTGEEMTVDVLSELKWSVVTVTVANEVEDDDKEEVAEEFQRHLLGFEFLLALFSHLLDDFPSLARRRIICFDNLCGRLYSKLIL